MRFAERDCGRLACGIEEHPRRTLPCLLRAVTELVENADETPPLKLSGQPGHSSTLHRTGAHNRASPRRKIDRMKRLATGLLLLALCPQGFGRGHEGHRIVSSRPPHRISNNTSSRPCPVLLPELLDHRLHSFGIGDGSSVEPCFCSSARSGTTACPSPARAAERAFRLPARTRRESRSSARTSCRSR